MSFDNLEIPENLNAYQVPIVYCITNLFAFLVQLAEMSVLENYCDLFSTSDVKLPIHVNIFSQF